MLTYNDPVAQANRHKAYAQGYNTQVALVTNKKIVFCFDEYVEGKNFLFNIKLDGDTAEMKKGRISDRWYIAVYFN